MNKKENPKKIDPKASRLKIRAICPDNYTRTVFEALVRLRCDLCSSAIHSGDHFTYHEGKASIIVTSKPEIKHDDKRYPVCNKCAPFREVDPWKNVEHITLSEDELKRGLELVVQEED